jgi:hypothetical protein
MVKIQPAFFLGLIGIVAAIAIEDSDIGWPIIMRDIHVAITTLVYPQFRDHFIDVIII